MGKLGWLARDRAVPMPRDPFGLREPGLDSRLGADDGRRRILCPRCGWEPGRHDRWACTCRNVWNTFETGGVCPACGREWAHTQCPRCGEWSRHEDWYVDE